MAVWLPLGMSLLVAGVSLAMAEDSSVVRLNLTNTGRDTDASGSVLSVLKSKSALVNLRAAGLTPGARYGVTVGEMPEAAVVADPQGRLSVTFSTRPRKNAALLDFDPRGRLLTLSDGGGAVLEAMVSGAGEPAGIVVDEKARLAPQGTAGAAGAEAEARYRVLADGRRSFVVKLERVTGADWNLYVDGIWRGAIPVAGRQTTVVYESAPAKPGRRLLDFDPRGLGIDIAQGTNLMFSGRLEARVTGVNEATPSVTQASLTSTGADADGTARVRVRVDREARRKVWIELEDVPVGAYEVLADGVSQGSIAVVAGDSGTEGEIEFSSRIDDNPSGDEQPLMFDPFTAALVVRKDGVVYFQGNLGGSGGSGGSGGNGDNVGLAPDSLAGLTLNLDDTPGGDLMQFTTASTGVDLGLDPDPFTYTVSRLGANQLRVDVRDGDKLDAYVFTFSTLVAGSWVRDEYRDGSLKDRDTGVFSVASGTNSGGSGGTNVTGTNSVWVMPARLEIPLFNLGVAAAASAKAEYKIDDRNRRSFEVEIEDAPVGAYTLWVGDAQVGSIQVVTTDHGTRGEIEFEDDDDGGLPLTFDPQGKWITIRREGTDYFQRVFPSVN